MRSQPPEFEEELFVFAEAVKKIEHGIAAGFIRIVAGWKKNAVRDAAAENFARDGAAFGAACGVGGACEEEATEQQEMSRLVAGTSKRGSSTARPGASRKTKARDASLGMTAKS